jgi:hypothetical protein
VSVPRLLSVAPRRPAQLPRRPDLREPDELVAARAELEEVNRAIAEELTADDAAEAA